MQIIEKSVVIHVPLEMAYQQWLHVEDFARMIDEVQEVRPLDARRSRWTIQVGSHERVFLSEITEQQDNQRIAWESRDCPVRAGEVHFCRAPCDSPLLPVQPDAAEGACTQITLRLTYDPENFMEKVAGQLGIIDRHVEKALYQFKQDLEHSLRPNTSPLA